MPIPPGRETERKVLVAKRIRVTFHLAADENYRETIERVVDVYADSGPVVRSTKDSI
jgi:intein/homing endonuclease